ncbi:MAG TPA: hypothetical protein VF641_11670 [Methylobacterium sp.]|jgi:hypothetical protein
MSINIKNREAEAILAELARHGPDAAPPCSISSAARGTASATTMREMAQGRESARLLRPDWNARPLMDARPVDEILAYDEHGLPC